MQKLLCIFLFIEERRASHRCFIKNRKKKRNSLASVVRSTRKHLFFSFFSSAFAFPTPRKKTPLEFTLRTGQHTQEKVLPLSVFLPLLVALTKTVRSQTGSLLLRCVSPHLHFVFIIESTYHYCIAVFSEINDYDGRRLFVYRK